MGGGSPSKRLPLGGIEVGNRHGFRASGCIGIGMWDVDSGSSMWG